MKLVYILPVILSCSSLLATDLGTKQGTQWTPSLEWTIVNPTWSGNAFDVRATVEFTHHPSAEKRRTEMFFVGEKSWAFRFTGTETGTWSFLTSSEDEDLHGHTGKVEIGTNPRADTHGFLKHFGNKWGWEGTGNVFVPQLVMWDATLTQTVVEHGLTSLGGGFSSKYFDSLTGKISSIVGPLGPAQAEPYDFDRQSPVTQTGRAMPVPGTHSINTPTAFGAGIMVDGVYASHATATSLWKAITMTMGLRCSTNEKSRSSRDDRQWRSMILCGDCLRCSICSLRRNRETFQTAIVRQSLTQIRTSSRPKSTFETAASATGWLRRRSRIPVWLDQMSTCV